MNKRLRALLAMPFLCGGCATNPPPLQSQVKLSVRWVSIGDLPRVSIALDTASVIRLDDGAYQVWIITTFATEQRMVGVRYTAMRKLLDADCSGRMTRIHRSVLFDSEGKQVFESEYPDPAQAKYKPLEPETLSEWEFLKICAYISNWKPT